MGDWSFAGGMKANPELYSRYEVLERLGEGTYGEVFKGKRKLDGLIVALKETRDPQCATREAEALLALNHPNVVKLIEYFVQGANLILVLEFMPSDLFRILEENTENNGRIAEAQVKGWMLQLLRGVAACHQASILHRDLKPSNLLVGADGSVKLADFGQARVVSLQSADLLGQFGFSRLVRTQFSFLFIIFEANGKRVSLPIVTL
jgi:serine/threonine protein kinase